ncbi:hypothetical protein D3C87_80740 [compost metagenome]
MNAFKVKCLSCGEKSILTSTIDSQMGFNSADINSSNLKITTTLKNKAFVLKCECGNTILEF